MNHLLILITTLLLTACSVDYQNTSGAAYLAAGEIDDPDLRRAAAYEPNLHFPARIGVVKLVYNQITTPPSAERAVFADTLSPVPAEIIQLGHWKRACPTTAITIGSTKTGSGSSPPLATWIMC